MQQYNYSKESHCWPGWTYIRLIAAWGRLQSGGVYLLLRGSSLQLINCYSLFLFSSYTWMVVHMYYEPKVWQVHHCKAFWVTSTVQKGFTPKKMISRPKHHLYTCTCESEVIGWHSSCSANAALKLLIWQIIPQILIWAMIRHHKNSHRVGIF